MEIIAQAYKASDGTLFSTYEECAEYEEELKDTQDFEREQLLDSIACGTAKINFDFFSDITLQELYLSSYDTIEELNSAIEDSNIIVFYNTDILKVPIFRAYQLTEMASCENVYKIINMFRFKKYRQTDNISKQIILYKINNRWLKETELFDKLDKIKEDLIKTHNVIIN